MLHDAAKTQKTTQDGPSLEALEPFYYPGLATSPVQISLDNSVATNADYLRGLTAGDASFAERMDTEIERLNPLYVALSDWVRYDVRASALKDHLMVDESAYQAIREKHHSVTPLVYHELLEVGLKHGFAMDELIRAAERSNPDQLNVKAMARMRMLLLKGIMYSSPVFVRDFFDGKRVRTGFGNQSEGVFQHKAEREGIRFSAIASPRVHKQKGEPESGYVFRYAVAKFQREGFEEDRAIQMLDGDVCDRLIAWNKDRFGDAPLEQNPLLSLAHRLNEKPIHDHVHSWFLYDASANTDAFLQWGLDIFDVEHVSAKDLLINYELLVGFMHNAAHRMLEWHNPELRTQTVNDLASYLDEVEDFTDWLNTQRDSFGLNEQDVTETRDYLVYIVASNLCFVHHPNEPEIKALLERYPAVLEQMMPRIGEMVDFVNSDPQGVPSRRYDGAVEKTGEYILRYPLLAEFQETLRKQQLRELLATGSGFQMASYSAYRALPEPIAQQLELTETIGNPSVFQEMTEALKEFETQLGPDNAPLYDAIVQRVQFKEKHFFLRLEREELDFEAMTDRPFHKKALLVQVPEGDPVHLAPRLIFGADQRITKQDILVEPGSFIGFNVRDDSHARSILEAGNQNMFNPVDVYAMIERANELGRSRGVKGAQDIYPLNPREALEIYGYDRGPGIYETSEIRQAADTVGPVEIPLRGGSLQRTLNGAFIYRAPTEDGMPALNADPTPDCWAPEWGSFRASYQDPTGTLKLSPYRLRSAVMDTMAGGAVSGDREQVHNALHRFHRRLRDINFQLDFGGFSGLADDQLYSQ